MRLIRLLKNDLAKEAANWVTLDLITPNQARNICRQYGIDFDRPPGHSYGYFILTALGYLFVALALITLIGANWESIPRAVRMAGLILLTLFIHLAGIRQYALSHQKAAVGLFFLGSCAYGTSIMLIAQIYHIGEHYPDGIFWWAAGVVPLALIMKSTLLMILGTGLAMIWFFTETSLDFFPVLFPAFLAAAGWHIVKNKQSNILFLCCAVGAALFLEYSLSFFIGEYRRFTIDIDNLIFGFGIFIFFSGAAKWLLHQSNPVFKDYGTLLSVWTLRFYLFSLFVLSFKEPWQEILEADWHQPVAVGIMNLALCTAAVGLTFLADKKIRHTVLFSLLTFCLHGVLFFVDLDHLDLILQISVNLLLVATGIWLIIQGIRHAISHFFFLGVAGILLTGLCRYVDLVGDYIGAAILFAVFAVILLTAATFWKRFHQKKGEAHVHAG